MEDTTSPTPSEEKEREPSPQTVRGLNSLLFFIADVRHGVGPLLAIYLKGTLGWDSGRIGLALSLAEVSSLIAQLPAGLLVDASKYKRLLIIFSCLVVITGCLTILAFSSFAAVIVSQLAMGVASAVISPCLGAITLGLFGRKRYPKRTSKNEMWNHAGNLATVSVAGIVSYLLGHEWIFYVVMMYATGSIISTLLIRPSEINHVIAREQAVDPTTNQKVSPVSLWDLFKRPPIIIFNISLILYYLTNEAQLALVGQVLSINNPQSSTLFMAASMMVAEATMIGIAYIMSLIVNRFGRKTFFLIAFSILPIRAFLYTITEHPFLFLSIQILDGTAAGILGVIGTVINSDLAIGTGRFNFLQSFSALSVSVGAFFSNFIIGYIVNSFGFNFGFLTLASFGVIGVFFFTFFMPETKPKNGNGYVH